MSDDPAKARFFIISIARLLGAVTVIVGLFIFLELIPAPRPIGIALIVLGFADFVFVPRFLSAQWRTPGE
ncbi:hypothetical protein [Novosphingopyxis sp. YJ-S2-01]|uniref:hypothetical protein n=1 Tax=Novosphingopyxis sp. YJ-S2-01 TaxID=2794021 RepID=UPI0018DD106B|nr:hypothetical protein [Novosphingopyxis sp. YJ-S2-01]MBH9538869.1 hypothetical protein [Novosphingopyxis sp. YJ-S2-01]|tara:strand:+ start:923 stop:1132 length:210 start_codon:yes stop_codon:yes gene_type:complete